MEQVHCIVIQPNVCYVIVNMRRQHMWLSQFCLHIKMQGRFYFLLLLNDPHFLICFTQEAVIFNETQWMNTSFYDSEHMLPHRSHARINNPNLHEKLLCHDQQQSTMREVRDKQRMTRKERKRAWCGLHTHSPMQVRERSCSKKKKNPDRYPWCPSSWTQSVTYSTWPA